MPLYTPMPKRPGERAVVEQLVGMGDPKLHIWCNLDFMPGVNDNDLLLWHESVGVFTVEIKAVPLSAIEIFGFRECKIVGRKRDNGPQYQASHAADSLRNYLGRTIPKSVFIIGSGCWPLISRDEWNRRWDDERVTGNYAERMLFQDDLFAGSAALQDRLRFIRRNPAVKAGTTRVFDHDPIILDAFVKALAVEARPIPTLTDLARLQLIEKQHREMADSDDSEGSTRRILYSGKPGTGKDFSTPTYRPTTRPGGKASSVRVLQQSIGRRHKTSAGIFQRARSRIWRIACV